MNTDVWTAERTAVGPRPATVGARSGLLSFALLTVLTALTAGAHSQVATEAAAHPLQAGDKITFQWPGTQRHSCAVVGSVDRGPDGMPWIWVQPVDLPLAVVHVSVDGTRHECKDLPAARSPKHIDARTSATAR